MELHQLRYFVAVADAGTFTATGLPAGLSINANTGVISGTVFASAGTYHVTVSAADGNVGSSISFTWLINQMPTSTVITSVQNTYVGLFQVETVTAQVTAADGVATNAGMVTFQVNGETLAAPVSNGFATVTFATPLLSLDFVILLRLWQRKRDILSFVVLSGVMSGELVTSWRTHRWGPDVILPTIPKESLVSKICPAPWSSPAHATISGDPAHPVAAAATATTSAAALCMTWAASCWTGPAICMWSTRATVVVAAACISAPTSRTSLRRAATTPIVSSP